MQSYSLYNLTTGVVTSTKSLLNEQEMIDTVAAIGNPNRGYVIGYNTPDKAYIKNGLSYDLPERTQPWMTWNLSTELWEDQRTQSEKDSDLSDLRSRSSLTRRELGLALTRRSIMTQADAILASRGEWPAVLQPFWDDLYDLDPGTAGEVLIEWAGSNSISRTDPNILTIASLLEISDADLDEIFNVRLE